jgi:phosphoserine aminotransferase
MRVMGFLGVLYVEKSVSSLMKVPLILGKSEMEGEFIEEASKENMVQL